MRNPGRPFTLNSRYSLALSVWLIVFTISFALVSCDAPADADRSASLLVSDDGTHLVYPDGTPFLWIGDTAWELFHRLDRKEAVHYLENRAEKGFSVVQAVVLAENAAIFGEYPGRRYRDKPIDWMLVIDAVTGNHSN